MGKINYSKVLIGGVAAGVVSIVLMMFVLSPIMMPMWEAAMKSGIYQQPTAQIFILDNAANLLLGIVAVFTYAAIRPRFGGSVKTALLAGILVAVLKDIGPGIGHALWSTEPRESVLLMSGLMAVSSVISTFVGAWIYTE